MTFQRKFVIIFCILCIVVFSQYPIKVIAESDFKPFHPHAAKENRNNEFSNSFGYWDELLNQSSNHFLALIHRGNVRLLLGESEGVIGDHTSAILLQPDNPESYFNRGVAEESLQMWEAAANDYNWILERDPTNFLTLYHLGNVMGSLEEWNEAKILFDKASYLSSSIASSRKIFLMASTSKALANYQLGEIDQAESDLRNIIRKNPMTADARAALTAVLWKKGFLGEAKSNWIAAVGLDSRYENRDWLLRVRRWPPKPVNDLLAFLSLEFS